ncbi:MAG TPA: hypothetical protein VJ553_02225 [Candidatus Paceibacterota bacterium]|nr:MAG: hypothetical protein A2Z31_01195 [candidate division NC10 bacterium RBG_16_65_8]HXK36372.1 hypothetical protein [Candidatus Paceibacterota bacterium]
MYSPKIEAVLDEVRDDPVRGPADALRRFDDQELAAFLLLVASGQIERSFDPERGITFRVTPEK